MADISVILYHCMSKIKINDALVWVGSDELKCLVMDCDDEWMKVQYTDKKGNVIVKLIRIESVDGVELIVG